MACRLTTWMVLKLVLACCVVMASDVRAWAHADDQVLPNVANKVSIEIRSGYRYITSNGIPEHKVGRFPNRHNPNTIKPQHYHFRMPAHPKAASRLTVLTNREDFGVAVNGVPFDPGTAAWWHNDRRSGWHYAAETGHMDLGLDANHAHVQHEGQYHYHGLPTGLIHRLNKTGKARMLLIGYAADGFPIYAQYGYRNAKDASSGVKKLKSSYRLKRGTRPEPPNGPGGPGGKYDGTFLQDFVYVPNLGDLDQANGRYGVTPEYPDGTYYYVLTDDFPFVPRYFRGTPDRSFFKRLPGGRGIPNRPGNRRPGRP